MHNWKSVVTKAASTRCARPQKELPIVLLSARCLGTGSRVTRLSARSQSTTRTNLAANHLQTLKEVPLSNELEEEEEDPSEIDNQMQRVTEQTLKPDKTHDFVTRHIGPSDQEIADMLEYLGYKHIDELIDRTVPDSIKLNRDLKLPAAISEHDLIETLAQIAKENTATEWKSYIGLGYYDCVTPPVILRNMFENPGWTTAYTAYQAEIAQGRLESLMNYQTMISDLTGLDVANASLLDEATAAAEAMQVCFRHSKSKRTKFLVSSRCFAQTKAVVETRAKPLGIEVRYFDELAQKPLDGLQLEDYSGILLQYPNNEGHLYDLSEITSEGHKAGCLVVASTDLMACTIFKPPGDFDEPVDIAIGSSQRFGVPLNFGGPHAGFMACKQKYLRLIPGRVVGLTRDSNGNRAYRFALQTREQHIRRDKATSNICTAQALLANMSAMYAVYHGPDGLKSIAESINKKTHLLGELVKQTSGQQAKIVNEGLFFDTLTIRVGDLEQIRARANEAKVNLRYAPDETGSAGTVSISLDETTKLVDVLKLASLFSASGGSMQQIDPSNFQDSSNHLAALRRSSDFLKHPTFNTYKSEAQLVRYMKSLENKDISLTHSMIPLGSCTMKLNATTQMVASSWPEFARVHPFQPSDQCKGYERLFDELEEYLCEITGYDKISFQPNSGAQGEYAGLRVIKAYLEATGQEKRNVCLIPISAHGTNPASAQMAGFQIQTIKVRDDGNVDLENLQENIDKHRDHLACLMITYPSTFGVFEDDVRQVCEMVHDAGGQVYLDGANMNAQVGLCRPGDYGSDVSHLNLHKTFCIPHGGGGPGAGPIGVKKHLAPYLPSHPVSKDSKVDDSSSFGTVSASMWGSPAILPISWSYIRLMSKDLKLSSQIAILNANYMRKRLQDHYKILFQGSQGNVAHEFIIDCRPFKKTANIEAVDIAKRLQDFGFHAPTVSWPVSNTLMVEPTESEDKRQLDQYCEALIQIRAEISAVESGLLPVDNNPIKNAPHAQSIVCSSDWHRPYSREQAAYPANFVRPETKMWPTVGRVDDTYGDTNLFCTCPPPETSA